MNKDLGVLVAGDDLKLISGIEKAFREAGYDYSLKSVKTLYDFRLFLKNNAFDIVLYDYNSEFSIKEALSSLQFLKIEVPFVVLVEDSEKTPGLDILKLGVSDYCEKDDITRLGSIIYRECKAFERRNEQRRFELELVKEIERLSVTFESIGDGVITTDQNGSIIMMNKGAEDLTGRSGSSSIGRPLCEIFTIVNKATYEPEQNPYERVLNEGKAVGLKKNTVLISKDGTIRYISASIAPIRDSDRRIMGVVVVFRDITRIRQAEEQLHKLSQAVEQSPSTVVIADTEGHIEYVNPKFTQTTGYSMNETIGKSLFFMKAEGQPVEVYNEIIKTLESGNEWRGEVRHKKKNGDIYWEFASFSPIRNSDGIITHYLEVSEDITERKQMAENLLKAKEAAEAANRAKSEFLANMSHEIRTPLNGIIGMTNLTIRTVLTNDQRENLNIINSCADLLLRVINDILDYSKIEAGKMTLENIRFDILKLMEKTYKAHFAQSKEKGLKLNFSIQKDMPQSLIGDPNRLQQVLNNLVSNAIKFTDVGEVKIGADVVETFEDSVKLRFTISDTGIGIDKKEMERLFKSFSQVDGSITRKYGGTGLGLAISKQIVEMMGGEIWVESEKEKGSIFYFTANFGYKIKEENKAGVVKEPPKVKAHQKLNILLVEDDKVNQMVMTRMLNSEEHAITIANNGIEAVKLFENNEFDLILMDIQMPLMDGIEATKRIRKMEEGTFRHIPIIAVTAYALKGDRERFLAAGMDDYIPKPISFEDFFEAMERVFGCEDELSERKADIREVDGDTEAPECGSALDIKHATEPEISLSSRMESLKSAIFAQNAVLIDKNALFIKEFGEAKGYSKIKSLAFKIQLLSRKNQFDEVLKLYEELSQEVGKENKISDQ